MFFMPFILILIGISMSTQSYIGDPKELVQIFFENTDLSSLKVSKSCSSQLNSFFTAFTQNITWPLTGKYI